MSILPKQYSTDGNASKERIPVYRPNLSGRERDYVLDCVDSSWISSLGQYIDKFESAMASATGAAHAISVCNGTVALHLAVHCLDIGPGDEVIVPTFTYIASVNAIAQTGATPVFVDSRGADWLIDPADVKRRLTTRTKAIMPVHLYGGVCDMDALCTIARQNDLKIVEDCAEALGSTVHGQHVGTFGDIGTFSFFGNKTVTTGEGGMVIASDIDLAERLRMTKGQGQSRTRRYWHEMLGFNYRMTNVAAAIGLAQIERLEWVLKRKQDIADEYRRLLTSSSLTFQARGDGVRSSDWLVSLLLPPGVDRDRVIADMDAHLIETRPVFYCAHQMPMYAKGEKFPIAEEISVRGMSLPSYPDLTFSDIERVVQTLSTVLLAQGFEV